MAEYQTSSDEEEGGIFISPELDTTFKSPYHLEEEEAVTLKKNYVLHMTTVGLGSETILALGLSSYEACTYSLESSLRCTTTLSAETSPLVDLRFSPDNPSLLYVGCSQGTIKLWDLRTTTKPVAQFKDTSDPKSKGLHEKEFCCFDINSTGRFLCAGTAVTDGDAFLLFWDTRQASLLGGYWECHTDDITQVKCHPTEKDRLLTGSTDGLINLYDISQTEEEDALLQSFNTESSVEKVKWHEGSEGTVSCITHTADVQFWHLDDSSPCNRFSREEIASALQMGSEQLADSLYVADIHTTSQEDMFMVLAGSNNGNGRCLRSGVTNSGELRPHSYFDGNKQIVRCSWFDPQRELLVTAGEGGIVSLWKSGHGEKVGNPNQLKATSKLKEKPHKTKIKPY